jgi:paraquat-inducible protein B
MKRFKKILIILIVPVFCACGAKQSNTAMPADYSPKESSLQNNVKPENIQVIDRKIVRQGEIKFKTSDLNETKSLIQQTVSELNGYISKDNVYDYSDRIEHRLIIRVPADKFDLLLKKISESVDKLDSKNIDAMDVTEEYIDVETRIRTKKELQNKYMELLKQANKMDDILSIHREIGDLQTEIESAEGRMIHLNNKITFSTLTVTYYQNILFGFFSKFVEAIKDGWSGFLLFIVGVSHLWVFILVATALVYFVIRKKRRKKKNKIFAEH